MNRHARVLAAAGLGFGTLGCSEPAAPGPALLAGQPESALRTDQSVYSASALNDDPRWRQYGFRIIATFENRTPRTLYLQRCYPNSPAPVFGIRMEPTGISAYSPVWACVGHDQQIAVRPGGIRTDTLHIPGPNGWDGATAEHFGQLEGRMRLHYYVQGCRGDGECRLDGYVSEPFTVELGP